jgi:hypothetical protein
MCAGYQNDKWRELQGLQPSKASRRAPAYRSVCRHLLLGKFRCYISDILRACRMRDPWYAASRVKSRFCCSSAHPPPTTPPPCCVLIHWTFCRRSVFQQPFNSTCMHSGCLAGCRLISSVPAYYIRTFRIRHYLFRTDSAHLHRYVYMRDVSVRKWPCRTLRNLLFGTCLQSVCIEECTIQGKAEFCSQSTEKPDRTRS